MAVDREAILSQLNEDFVVFQSPTRIDDPNEDTRVGKHDPSLLLQVHELVQLHGVQH